MIAMIAAIIDIYIYTYTISTIIMNTTTIFIRSSNIMITIYSQP
jgi:hypothetical protein